MQGMQMGMNQFKLLLQQDTSRDEIWKTNVVLPICVSGRKDWLVKLIIKTKNKINDYYFLMTI